MFHSQVNRQDSICLCSPHNLTAIVDNEIHNEGRKGSGHVVKMLFLVVLYHSGM